MDYIIIFSILIFFIYNCKIYFKKAGIILKFVKVTHYSSYEFIAIEYNLHSFFLN